MKRLPPSPIAWSITLISVILFFAFIIFIADALKVELGMKHVAAGGGEYMVALFIGLPLLLLTTISSGIAVAVGKWRSWFACAVLGLALSWNLIIIVRFVADAIKRAV